MPQSDHLQSKLRLEIDDLSESINGLIEAFRKLRTPLLESQQKVPQATSQLDKISEQTEAAAHRMLDMVELITQREQEIIGGLSAIRTLSADGRTTEVEAMAKKLEEQASTNLNDAYTIMDALQFQDITSQQMDHAASLLEEIESKLRNILAVVGVNASAQIGPAEQQKKVRAYDPHADLSDKRTQQADIDSIFNAQRVK